MGEDKGVEMGVEGGEGLGGLSGVLFPCPYARWPLYLVNPSFFLSAVFCPKAVSSPRFP